MANQGDEDLATAEPSVPPRRSSRGIILKDSEILSLRSSSLASSIEKKKKKLKHSGSFDSDDWTDASEVVAAEIEKTIADKRVKHAKYLDRGGKEEEWVFEEIKVDLDARKRTLSSKLPLLRKQASRTNLSDKGQEAATLRSYIILFTTSMAGLNIKSERRQRNNSVQSNFRTAIIDCYDLRGSRLDIDQI